jgi:Protein of unknown function (DUF1501)
MLRILGSAKRLCDGLTRREMLLAGGLGLFGLQATDLLRLQAVPPPADPAAGFGKAKACILLYLYGAPSQLETFDLKPDAPVDVRGDFKPIATSAPGVQICEYLPRTAQVMHRTTLVRSMTHPYNIHSAAYTLTGTPTTDIPMELNPRDVRHWPFFGSVLDYLNSAEAAKPKRELPSNVGLPWKFSSRSEPFRRGGPFGGFLGGGYDPVWVEFAGSAPKGDPYKAITSDGRFQLGQPGAPELTLDRLDHRRSLLHQLDDQRRAREAAPEQGFDRQQQMAFDLTTSPKMRTALDISRETTSVRERYGLTLFGQSVLTARRLVENGVRLVTVFWDEFKDANSAWDTHVQQIPRLKDELLPGFDLAYSALLEDLEARGLLDETLVACVSEHGRTPKLNNAAGGGREHWSGAYCGLFAGGGIKRGAVLGATDRTAAFPKEHPVSPKDILCTLYHLMGVDPRTVIHDREGRPVALVPEGEVQTGMLA